jgi:hypothetical protein
MRNGGGRGTRPAGRSDRRRAGPRHRHREEAQARPVRAMELCRPADYAEFWLACLVGWRFAAGRLSIVLDPVACPRSPLYRFREEMVTVTLRVPRVRVSGPLTPYVESFGRLLLEQGYTPSSARGQLESALRLSADMADSCISSSSRRLFTVSGGSLTVSRPPPTLGASAMPSWENRGQRLHESQHGEHTAAAGGVHRGWLPAVTSCRCRACGGPSAERRQCLCGATEVPESH